MSAMSPAQHTALEAPANTTPPRTGWHAELALSFAHRDGRTYLAQRRHTGPLLVQRPFFPEPGACHVYIVHPPGGIVGGDDLSTTIEAGPQSHAVLTTPAATKFYRSEARFAKQMQTFDVRDATLEWLPQETIFYPDSHARSETIVRANASSRFVAWEIPCFGLPARAEPFDRGKLQLGLEVWIDGQPRVIDRLRIDGSNSARTAMWGLASYDAIGTLVACPADASMLTALRAIEFTGVEFAASVVDGVLVCRCLGSQAEAVKRAFVTAWRTLRPMLLGREAVLPRIWAT